jgi:regulator of sirC expression with transglutaminase-like and TPR domain
VSDLRLGGDEDRQVLVEFRLMAAMDLWTAYDARRLPAVQTALAGEAGGAAVLASAAAPAARQEATRATLSDWGRRVAERLAARRPGDQHAAMQAVLVGELDLQGDPEQYDDPRNSHLSLVVERRRGLPILLSAAWMLVGEAAGVPVAGVGLPFHFIVRVGMGDPIFADPFHGGRVLSRGDCRALVGKLSGDTLPWSDDFLAPAPVASIAERVLRNLSNHYDRAGRPERQYRAARFLAALRPHDPVPQLAHARVADTLGARSLAISLYADLVDRFPGSREAVWARRRGEDLGRTPVVLH